MKNLYYLFATLMLSIPSQAQIAFPKSELIQYELNKLYVVDDKFINSLDSIIFNESSKPRIEERYKYLSLIFTPIDDDFKIDVILYKKPWSLSKAAKVGFFERNNYIYMIFGTTPENIFRKEEIKQRFKYMYHPINFDDDYLEWSIVYENLVLTLTEFIYY